MRRRLLTSTLVVALVSVILLGIPLGVVATKLIRDEAQKRMNHEAAQVAADLDSGQLSYFPLTTEILSRFTAVDRQVVVRIAGTRTVVAGQKIGGPVQKGTATGSYNDLVTVYGSESGTNREVATVWLVVGALAVVALGAAVELARLQAKRLAVPLQDLVEGAERLGSGDARPRNRSYGVPEFDRVAAVLDRSAARIGGLLSAERELAANASHQLRTPLTALSIRLEEIIATSTEPGVRDEATAALAQAERLTAVIDELLEHARTARTSSAVVVDVDDVLAQQRIEWDPAFRRLGRDLDIDGRPGLKAHASPGGLAQVVATLVDNALTHGGGAVSVRTRHSAGHVVIEVADEGPGVPDVLVPHIFERSFSGNGGNGLGLSLARDLIEADGGRLELVHPRPPTFAVFLAPESPAKSDDGG